MVSERRVSMKDLFDFLKSKATENDILKYADEDANGRLFSPTRPTFVHNRNKDTGYILLPGDNIPKTKYPDGTIGPAPAYGLSDDGATFDLYFPVTQVFYSIFKDGNDEKIGLTGEVQQNISCTPIRIKEWERIIRAKVPLDDDSLNINRTANESYA